MISTSALIGLVPEMFHDIVDLFHLESMIFHDCTKRMSTSITLPDEGTHTCQVLSHTSPSRCSPYQKPVAS